MSTHAALVSRALGAKQIIMCGADEDDTINSVRRINERWGGSFQTSHMNSWREVVRNWRGLKIHLTMYGEPIDQAIPKIEQRLKQIVEEEKQILLIIGSEKVPREVYSLADYNVAVGNQPHSEVAALAIFLDRIYKGKELYSTFGNARIRIKPSLKGKEIENLI
jgi:tRNA (cytidine56-2'-O)-methyltransferase